MDEGARGLHQKARMKPTQAPATFVDPTTHARILGQGFATHDHRPLLVIGRHQWNRWSLGRLGCPHPMAAAKLNRVIQQMQITTLGDLADRAHEIGCFKGLGVTSYWTVLAILEGAGYNVEQVHAADVTYQTIKGRALKEEATPKPRKKRRR